MKQALIPVLLILAGCSGGGGPFTKVEYSWRAGSMPPPHHYEIDITLGSDGQGQIVYRPDYSKTPEWKETFTAAAGDVDKLQRLMADVGVFSKTWSEQKSPPVGGNYEWMAVTVGAEVRKTPSHPTHPGRLGEVHEAIRALVPKALWDGLTAKRDEYVKNYKSK
jgi:hypothetical protein